MLSTSLLRKLVPPLAFLIVMALVSVPDLSAQDAEGTTDGEEVGDNGTNPASMGFKWMSYSRSTELKNGVKDIDALALFFMMPLDFLTPVSALVIEWPILKYRDYSTILERDQEGELIGQPPAFAGGIPPGIDTQRLGRGDLFGWGDVRFRFLQGITMVKSTVLMTGLDFMAPWASDIGLSSGKYQLAPIFAHITNFDPTSFLAVLHFYFFDIADGSAKGSSEMGDIGFYMARIFYQKAFPSSGYYLLPEVQVIYDFEVPDEESAFSLWFGPEVGKSFQAGGTGITTYIKPGFGINADPGERKWSVEMGMRFIPLK